jgi:hypothetical protein
MAGIKNKRKEKLILGFLFLTLIIGFQPYPLFAQNEIPDSLITKRLEFLEKTLKNDNTNTKRWWYGWLAGYSAATLGQGAVYFSSNSKTTRQDMVLGAATTFLGAAGQFITPLTPRKEIKNFFPLPSAFKDDRLKKLIIAENLLSECAKREKEARNWQNHALTGAVNLGSGLITWLGFKRTIWDGLANFALNTTITETQIWSQPTLAKRNYKNYCLKYLKNRESFSYTPEVNYYLEAFPGGIGIKVVF